MSGLPIMLAEINFIYIHSLWLKVCHSLEHFPAFAALPFCLSAYILQI